MAAVQSGAARVRDRRLPIDIEDLLIWTYRDQRAEVVIGRGVGLHGVEAESDGIWNPNVSACGCAAIERIQRVGTMIDGGGWAAGHLDGDAETVHHAVVNLPSLARSLVIRHARLADRPDWLPGRRPVAKPCFNGKGKPTVRYEPWDRSRNYGWCPIEWTISAARIANARQEYDLWHSALELLADQLGGALWRYRPFRPAAPAAPWDC